MASLRGVKVGESIYVHDQRREAALREVLGIGRKWVTVAGEYCKFDLDSGSNNNSGYSFPWAETIEEFKVKKVRAVLLEALHEWGLFPDRLDAKRAKYQLSDEQLAEVAELLKTFGQ